MRRKRPCRVCRRWFLPGPRAGDRQRTCSEPSCQQERHRRACADWHRRNPDYDRGERLRRRLRRSDEEAGGARGGALPQGRIDWSVARDAVGLQGAVLAEELAEVIADWTRDAVGPKPIGLTRQSAEVSPFGPRDDMAGPRRPP